MSDNLLATLHEPMGTSTLGVPAYLRVSSVAIAIYDFLQTIWISWTFVKSRRITSTFVLYFLIRYISIIVITLSTIGFFYTGFTYESCKKFFLVPPTFKVLQQMVSQAVMGIRTFNLSRRSPLVGWPILVIYVASIVMEAIATLYRRSPTMAVGNCLATTNTHGFASAYVHYVVAIAYDVILTATSIYFLLRYKSTSHSSVISKLSKMMIFDGIGYFVALTASNLVNLIFYKSFSDSEYQTAAVSVGYAVTWIMSQKLLIHLHKASLDHQNDSLDAVVTVTQNLDSAQDISYALRSQFESKSGDRHHHHRHRHHRSRRDDDRYDDLTVPDFDLTEEGHTHSQLSSPEHAVTVKIERTIALERRHRPYQLEDYSSRGKVHSRSTESAYVHPRR